MFFSTVYPGPRAPTLGVYNRSLVEALSRHHEVRVVAPVPWVRLLEPVRSSWTGDSGVDVRRPIFLYPPGVLRGRLGRFLWASARRTVRQVLDGFRPDVIVSYWAHPDGEAALSAAGAACAPLVQIVGGSDVLILPRDPVRRRLVERVLRSCGAVLAVGEDLRQRVVALGVDQKKVHTFSRGVSEHFRPGDRMAARAALRLPAESRILLWVGNMVPVKGIDVLFGAVESLVGDDGLDVLLCLVGDGPLRSRLERRARQSILKGRVRFAGAVDQRQLPTWYQAADLTVLPSLSEGTPNVLLESMACGTPFVASDVGSVRVLSQRPTEELVPAGDAPALRRLLRRRLESGPDHQEYSPRLRWSDSATALTEVARGVVALAVRASR